MPLFKDWQKTIANLVRFEEVGAMVDCISTKSLTPMQSEVKVLFCSGSLRTQSQTVLGAGPVAAVVEA